MTKLKAFLLGIYEFRYVWTWADPHRSDDNPYTILDEYYDKGREFAHKVTLRFYEP